MRRKGLLDDSVLVERVREAADRRRAGRKLPRIPPTRTLNVVFVGANRGAGLRVTATLDRVVTHSGRP